ncbi:hypothetical protein PG994_007789 [Apiospora phragmitis]|uniref:Uncharacterized protein n=1 Tax=Apiospora phragmitis TaxID=2905665 RepID=A0ABR1UR75_9PEZI
MAPKRKQYGRPGEPSDDGDEQERPAQRARHSSRSSSQALLEGTKAAKARFYEKPPKIVIPTILNYLQDGDIDHTANWSSKLEDIIAYLEYADELRRNGHKDFDEQLQGDLFDCQVVIGVHRAYEKRNRGKTPYSNTKLPTAQPQSRLAWYDRLLPITKKTRANARISLIPREGARNSSPFHLIGKNCDPHLYNLYFQTSGGQRLVQNLTMLHRDESMLWQQGSTTKPAGKPTEPNLAELENHVYEECVTSRHDLVKSQHWSYRSSVKNEDVPVEDAVKQRGWRRAALQQLLQLFDNQENRAVNTPWRRVALPAPIKERKELPFHTAARLRNRVEVDDGVTGVSNVLSSFTRRNYMLASWNNRMSVAVPPNFQGPFTFSGRCVYDDNWLKVGRDCVLLSKNLKRAAGMYQPDCRFLPTLIEDIERGLCGGTPATSLRPRPQVDFDPTKENTFLLLDEFDMAWLKFLMVPGSAPGLIKYSNKEPQDNLLILFDHRIQTLFNDTHQNMFWAKTESSEDYKGFPSYTSQKVPLTELLAIINRGGRKLGKEKGHLIWTASDLNDHDTNPPNTLYQFTLEEARFACIKLARQGRLFYEGPILEDVDEYVNSTEWDQDTQCRFYQTDDRNDWGRVGMHKTEIFPEQRIIWRHEDDEAFIKFNRAYKQHTSGIFPADQEEGKSKGFVAETVFKVGIYPEGGFEEARQSPIWEDIVPIDMAAAQELGLSERTSQFFRNLAFRLGRTIRHYQQLQQRSAKSPGLPRKDLNSKSALWQQMVGDVTGTAKQAGYKPIRLTQLTDVIPRAAPGHPAAQSTDLTTIFTTIRKGLINDSVKNYTQTYPSRPCFQIDENGCVIKTFQRQNLWGWADKMIREHHAPYIRKRYFDVRRWPLHRQSEATQKIIRTREDENIYLQSPLAWYRYGIRVGPASKGALGRYENSIIDVLPSKQQLAASELVKKFKQALVVSMRNANVSLQDEWEFIINPPLRDPWRLLPAGQTLQPIVRPTSKFIPGPPVFPMGDTLLKQIQISQELESILDPQQPQNIGTKLLDKVASWFSPEPERIPLLPEIDENRAPRSNPRKRRLPSAFLSEIEPAKKVPALSDPFNDRAPTRPRHLHDVRSRRLKSARAGVGSSAMDTAEEREQSRRERVEAVATLLRGKVVDQVQKAAIASAEAPAPPAWKVKSKAQDARKPDEVPTVEIVRNVDGASATKGESAGGAGKKVTSDVTKSKQAEEGYVWPASVRRPRYSIVQEDGKNIVIIDQDELGGLERAVRVPSSQWPAAEVAPPNIILRVNPSEQTQRAPLSNPFTDDDSFTDLPRKKNTTMPGFVFGSKSPLVSPFTSQVPSVASATPAQSSRRDSTAVQSSRRSSTAATSVTTTTSVSTPPTSAGSSRRGSRSRIKPKPAAKPAEMVKLPTGQSIDISGVPAADGNGKPRHVTARGWVALQHETFPHGYQAVPTPGLSNHCGVYAMVISMRKQLATIPGAKDVTYERLLALGTDPRVQERLAAVGRELARGFDARTNFTVDILAAMLEGWGTAHGVRLHLGIVFPAGTRDPFVLVNERPANAKEYVVWIHSGDASFRGRRDGMSDQQVIDEDQRMDNTVYNHFSGLMPQTRSSQRLRQK